MTNSTARRDSLPVDRMCITHEFSVGGVKGIMRIGLYPNGQPGEIFLQIAKGGSTLRGLTDSLAVMISVALQHGVPLRTICRQLKGWRFEPCGFTVGVVQNSDSLVDYLARYLEMRFIGRE